VIFFAGRLSAQTSPHGTLQYDCSDCHVSTSWKEIPAQKNFKHETTKFALTGQHKNVQCKQCHTTLKFSEAKMECNSCHKDIHKNTVSSDCSSCHTPSAWLIKNITDIHQRSRFPLLGQHAKADCRSCHTLYAELNFQPLGVKCYDCHKQNYASTQNPNHVQSNFSTDCETCHNFTNAAWGYASFAHDFFPLQGGHKIADCRFCHKTVGNYTGLSKECYTCHKTKFEQTTNPNHIAAAFNTTCTTCHTINGWKPSSFNHSQYFTLVGAHTQLDCNKCHSVSYANTPTDCYGCHKNTFEATTNPNHVNSKFPTDCTKCHTSSAWIPSSFNHATTQFPLTGAHTSVSCANCHTTGYTNTPTDCYSCHAQNYNSTTNPNHAASQFPTTCNQCHSTTGWKPASFDHSTTQFPLTGAHTAVACVQCHTSGYTSTPKDCYSCHKANYDATTNPKHSIASGFPTTCNQCHSTTGWKPASFDHSTTQFPLTGAHASVTDCTKCHATGYTGTSTDCYSCHKQKYDATTNPKHSTAGFTTACKDCHKTTAWTPATFDHTAYFPIASGKHTGISCTTCHNTANYANFTCLSGGCHPKSSTDNKHVGEVNGYSYVSSECYRCHPNGKGEFSFNHSNSRLPLTGNHLTISCESCHVPTSTTLSPECSSCHLKSYSSSVTANHQTLGLSEDCSSCHSCEVWKPSIFNHAATAFPLTGKHATVTDCANCHKGLAKSTTQVCNNCHQQNYTSSVNPNHQAIGLGNDCNVCHTTDGWKPSTFNHAATAFPLTGKHATVTDCTNCHKGLAKGTTQVCNDCHQQNYTSSVNPNHQAIGLGTACEKCHTSTGWIPSSFSHTTTSFPLTGGHTKAACSSCHINKTTGTDTQCYSCHKANYDGVQDPNHVVSKFSTDCTLCHSTSAWIPATFNHASTQFPLVGAHTNLDCLKCHASGYTNTAKDCYSCHKSNYDASINPRHLSAQFPHECETCHTQNVWVPSTFKHDIKFPIYSGKHKGEWTLCSDCHTTASNYQAFSCINCHEHNNKSSVDKDHNGVNNYSYVSSECYRCHPTGKDLGQIKSIIKSIEK